MMMNGYKVTETVPGQEPKKWYFGLTFQWRTLEDAAKALHDRWYNEIDEFGLDGYPLPQQAEGETDEDYNARLNDYHAHVLDWIIGLEGMDIGSTRFRIESVDLGQIYVGTECATSARGLVNLEPILPLANFDDLYTAADAEDVLRNFADGECWDYSLTREPYGWTITRDEDGEKIATHYCWVSACEGDAQ